ncbi:hypothetical protein NMG60_11007998 [Bertholletia excelsa]
MRDDDILPVSTPTGLASTAATTTITKKESSDSSGSGKGRYKFWALAAILLLAFWSMLTGTVTLRWSAGNLNHFFDESEISIRNDLDVLEMEEREKLVKHMWDVYTNSHRIGLPRFWQEAFEAAYEDLTSEEPGVHGTAISEIATMSLGFIDFEPPPLQSSSIPELSLKQELNSNREVSSKSS